MTTFFVHQGNPFYLKYALAQVLSVMPEARVILLGDQSNQHILKDKIEWYPIKDYWRTASEFEKIYVHLSPNSKEFELFCFQRWMVVDEWVQNHKLVGQICYLDSDVLVFSKLGDFLPKSSAMLATTKEIGPAFTLFHSQDVLRNFIEFILSSYTDQEKLSLLQKIYYDGISPFWMKNRYVSDMHVLGLFSRTVTTLDLSQEVDSGVFDYAFHEDEGFAYDPCKRIKKLWWDNEKQKYFGFRNGKKLYFHGLHFQVGTKVFLPHFYTGKVIFKDVIFHKLIQYKGYLTSLIKKMLGKC